MNRDHSGFQKEPPSRGWLRHALVCVIVCWAVCPNIDAGAKNKTDMGFVRSPCRDVVIQQFAVSVVRERPSAEPNSPNISRRNKFSFYRAGYLLTRDNKDLASDGELRGCERVDWISGGFYQDPGTTFDTCDQGRTFAGVASGQCYRKSFTFINAWGHNDAVSTYPWSVGFSGQIIGGLRFIGDPVANFNASLDLLGRGLHFLQLISENPPTKSSEYNGPDEQEERPYINKTLYLVLSLGLVALSVIGVNKALDRSGYIGGIFLVLCSLPFAAGMCCFLYGFLDLSFP
jgi:hypothetical protein